MNTVTATASPDSQAAAVALGVTELMIRDLVHAFYVRARRDPLLRPIFETEVQNWNSHLDTMCAFWSSVILVSGRYSGHPLGPHLRIAVLGKTHFARWLELFKGTASELCTAEAAALFIDHAERIAQSLQLGIAFSGARQRPVQKPTEGTSKEDV